MANKDFVNYRISSLRAEVPKLKKKANGIVQALTHFDNELENLSTRIEQLGTAVDNYELTINKNHARIVTRLERKIAELEAKLAKKNFADPVSTTNPVALEKATTIAIFDSILSAITSWSVHGDLASDVEMASQAVIFPTVYERVMSGEDPAYLLSDVPESAEVVVQRGREYVKWVRSQCETQITTDTAWDVYAPSIQEWWINDALPLLYGEADPDWENDTPYTLEQLEVWKTNPADRMVAFPKIYDAMELLKMNRQEINKSTRILEFNLKTAENRIE